MPKTRIPSDQTVGSHIPATGWASPAPGHGGIVTATASSGSLPSQRNWNWAPAGSVMKTPGAASVISSRSPSLRHIRPRPAVKHQISSTVRGRPLATRCPEADGRRPCCRATASPADEPRSRPVRSHPAQRRFSRSRTSSASPCAVDHGSAQNGASNRPLHALISYAAAPPVAVTINQHLSQQSDDAASAASLQQNLASCLR